MRGFLRTGDFVYPLQAKLTTIGREGNDIIVQSSAVDNRHAIVEFVENEDCFVLKDLDSSQGTFVNDCRIHSASVRLTNGDKIRFGFVGPMFEFVTDSGSQVPPVVGLSANRQTGLTVINEPAFLQPPTSAGFPTIPGSPGLIPSHSLGHPSSLPRPPGSARIPGGAGRPMSAGSARRQTTGPTFQSPTPPSQPMRGGWLAGPTRTPGSPSQSSPTVDIQIVQEKEQKILALQAEVSRLQVLEVDAAQKDQTVHDLKSQVSSLQQQLNALADPDIKQKVLRMEQELAAKTVEVSQLRDRLSHTSSSLGASGGVSQAGLRMELTSSQVDAAQVRNELDRVRKEKMITSGLVTQLQRDLGSKDTTISRLTREIEALKREVKEKDVTISAIQTKFARIKDSKKAEEDREAREKDLVTLRQRLKAAETKCAELEQAGRRVHGELESARNAESQHTVKQHQLERELDDARSQCADVQRSERMIRVDMQEAIKKYERLRNRVMQVAFSTPGIRAPDDEIRDDQLIEMLRRVVDERTEFFKKITDLKDTLKAANTGKKEINDSVRKFKNTLGASLSRLQRGRLPGALRDELSVLQAEIVDPSLHPVKEVIVTDLQHQFKWAQEIETALEKSGVNVKLSSDSPAAHITAMMTKWEGSITERDRIKARLATLEQDHRSELSLLSKKLEAGVEARISEAVERANLRSSEKLRQAIDDVTRAEAEKRETAVQAERDRIAELNETVAQLQRSLVERQDETAERLQEAEQALERLTEYERLVTELQETIESNNRARSSLENDASEAQRQAELRFREEISDLEERLRQAAVATASGEERLQKQTRKAKDLANEVAQLKKENSELRNRPSPRPKESSREVPPRVILQKPTAEISALEKTVQTLRIEKKEMETQVAKQDAVIAGLKQELAAAAARISDSRGELSNNAKEELSRQRLRIRELEQQLNNVKNQLRQMADETERLRQQMLEKENENSKERLKVNRLTNTVGERDEMIRNLEATLADERSRIAKELAARADEGRIASELTAMGAACRGERHESIIAHQKEALSEMRQRVKQLEQLRPPVPSHDVAMQQVAVLKKEMAEMRANKAQADLSAITPLQITNGNNGTSEPPNLDRQRSLVAHDMNSERSAHKETQMALEVSEGTYLSLVRAMASNLELESVEGMRSVSHLPRDERERLAEERDKACSLLSQRIRILKERLSRKEELMHSYEEDLARLKQAEELAARKHAQVENLVKDVRLKSEETDLLRESLLKTKDELNQEKRLNTAIKQKKTFHLERNGSARPKSPTKKSISFAPEDNQKSEGKLRTQKEKSKRRDYEIHTLKSELATREQDLCRATSRLVNMETTMNNMQKQQQNLLLRHRELLALRAPRPVTAGANNEERPPSYSSELQRPKTAIERRTSLDVNDNMSLSQLSELAQPNSSPPPTYERRQSVDRPGSAASVSSASTRSSTLRQLASNGGLNSIDDFRE